MQVLGLGALWKVSVTDAEAGNGLAGPRDGSSPPGSHGDLGAVGGAQVLIVEAAPHAPPQRVGPAVRLVSKICGESGGGQSAARPAHTHTHTQTRQGKVLLEASQSSLCRQRRDFHPTRAEGSGYGRALSLRPQAAGNTGGGDAGGLVRSPPGRWC